MNFRPLARLAAPTLALLTLTHALPADAGSPYPGWRGQFGEPYTAYKAGANFDDDRRALDGSTRSPPALPAPGTWTGLYAGAHLGAGLGNIETTNLANASFDANTFLGGVHAGYNLQINNFVAGFEVDGTWASTSSDTASIGGLTIGAGGDWLTSARLRLGYTSGQFMVYATGGLALGDLDVTLDQPGFAAAMSQTMAGYAVGGGVEMKLTESWIARVEALHYGFAQEQFKSSLGTLDIDTDVTTIRAGLSLRLN